MYIPSIYRDRLQKLGPHILSPFPERLSTEGVEAKAADPSRASASSSALGQSTELELLLNPLSRQVRRGGQFSLPSYVRMILSDGGEEQSWTFHHQMHGRLPLCICKCPETTVPVDLAQNREPCPPWHTYNSQRHHGGHTCVRRGHQVPCVYIYRPTCTDIHLRTCTAIVSYIHAYNRVNTGSFKSTLLCESTAVVCKPENKRCSLCMRSN